MKPPTPSSPPPEKPRRQRMKADQRRRQLIDVAIGLFAEKGFAGTTTREIALAADVNEAIIFRHFETKEGLFAAILDQRARDTLSEKELDALDGLATLDDDEGFFRFFVQRILHAYRDHPQYQRILLFASLQNHPFENSYFERFVAPAHKSVREYVEKRQRQGVFRPGDARLAVFAVTSMAVQYATNRWLFGRHSPRVSEEEAVRRITDLFLDGLRGYSTAAPGR